LGVVDLRDLGGSGSIEEIAERVLQLGDYTEERQAVLHRAMCFDLLRGTDDDVVEMAHFGELDAEASGPSREFARVRQPS
jgi:hypothetical protein